MDSSLVIDQEVMRSCTVEDFVISELDGFEERMAYGEFESAYGSLAVIQQLLINVSIRSDHEKIWLLYKKAVLYLERRSRGLSWWRREAKKNAEAAVAFLKHLGLGTHRKLMAEKDGVRITDDAWNAQWQGLNTDSRKMDEESKRVWG